MEENYKSDFEKEDRNIQNADEDPTKLYITYESLFPNGVYFQNKNYIPLQDGTYPVRCGTIRADNKHSYQDVTIENFRIKKFVKYYPQGHIKVPHSIDYYTYLQEGCYEVCHRQRVGGKIQGYTSLYYENKEGSMATIAARISELEKSENIKKIVIGRHSIPEKECKSIDVYFKHKESEESS